MDSGDMSRTQKRVAGCLGCDCTSLQSHDRSSKQWQITFIILSLREGVEGRHQPPHLQKRRFEDNLVTDIMRGTTWKSEKERENHNRQRIRTGSAWARHSRSALAAPNCAPRSGRRGRCFLLPPLPAVGVVSEGSMVGSAQSNSSPEGTPAGR